MATVTAPPPVVIPEAYERSVFAPVTTWLTTTDHKLIGIMYMVSSFLAFLVAGIFALVIRVQLAQPNMNVVDAETYNQLVSAHGTTMIFFFVTLFLTGLANYIVPIMVGARDMAFPRVNALGFWLVPVSIRLYSAGLFPGGDQDRGGAGYPPLTSKHLNPGLGVGLWKMSR